MRDIRINSITAVTLDQWAFAGLLATVFSIAFSIALGQCFAALTFLLFVLACSRRQVRLRLPSVMWIAIAFIVVAVATSWGGAGIHGLWRRTGKLLWFALIPVTASLAGLPGRPVRLLRAFLYGCLVLALRDLIRNPFRAWQRPVPDYLTALIDKGSMTDGQMLMLGLVAGTLMLLATPPGGRPSRGWIGGMLAIQAAGLMIGFKRGSWFCAMLLVGWVLLSQMRWRAWVLMVLVTAACFALPPVQTRMGQLRTELNVDGGGRLTMWCRVLPFLIQERPQGMGYGCLTNREMRHAFRRVEPNRNHLHANWAQVLVETGWLGLAVYGLWMGKALADAARGLRMAANRSPVEQAVARAVVLMLAGLLLNGLVEYNFGDTELMFIYAVLMGMACAGGIGGRAEETEGSAA